MSYDNECHVWHADHEFCCLFGLEEYQYDGTTTRATVARPCSPLESSLRVLQRHKKFNSSVLSSVHRIVICLTISPPLLVTPASRDPADVDPGFFSKIFQNFRLSSAATPCQSSAKDSWVGHSLPAVASIWPSGLKQLCRTLVSCAGISTLRTKVG